MDKFLWLLRFLLNVLLCVATLVGAVLGYIQYRSEYGEPIGDIMKWLSPYLVLPFWCWVGITIAGAAALLFLRWRGKLKRLGKSAAQGLDDSELRRTMRRRLRFGRFTKHYRELVPLYFCTRRSPGCACVHGAAILLTATSSPSTLFMVLVWLRSKLTSIPHRFPYPLHLLNTLAGALQTQINKRRWFWPKDFHKIFRQVAMDTYNAVAYYVVETLKESLFLLWEQKLPGRYSVKVLRNAALEHDSMEKCQREWKVECQDFTNTAWSLFETIADPIDGWLSSLDTPVEVEEATLRQIIPTLFALPVKIMLSHGQVATILPKTQQLAEKIAPLIWRSRQDCGIEVWLRRSQLVFETRVLVYLMRWLDIGDQQTILERACAELEGLYEANIEGNIQLADTDKAFAEFDQQLEKILEGAREVDNAWAQNLLDRVESLSKRAQSEKVLPIVTTCENLTRKLKATLERV